MIDKNDRPVANPLMILREEFDDWAVLFNPDTGDTFGLGPVSCFVWKRLDGLHDIQDVVDELRENCGNVPDDGGAQIKEFVEDLIDHGLAGYEMKRK